MLDNRTEVKERLLTVKEVAALLGVGVSTVWYLAKNKRIPKPVKLSEQVTRWKSSEVSSFLSDPEGWVGA